MLMDKTHFRLAFLFALPGLLIALGAPAPGVQAVGKPPLDLAAPAKIETATFALG
jgi:hypothetical protein